MNAGQGYTFGPYRLDPSEGRLTRNGEPVRVPSNVLALLIVLVARAGYLVSNQELIADAWPNAAPDADKLAVAVATLRTALHDERGEEYLETVPGIGYRFIAPVVQSRLDAVWLDPATGDPLGARPRWSMAWAAAGVLVLVIAVGAALLSGRARAGTAPTRPMSSLVVVPFQTVGPQGEQAYLGLGMADALAMRLGGVEQLRVPPAAAVQPSEDAFDAGRRLAVDAVITGAIQRDGGRVRVTAQLSRVDDRAQIWNARFDDSFTDIFTVQDAIADRIVSSLLRSVNAGERAALHRRETDNVEAYDRYLRGRERWSRRTVEATQAAIQLYQEAIALDPAFATAYAALANAYVSNASGLSTAERLPLARAAVDHALAINPDLADAQVARGYVLYRGDWQFAESEQALRKAIALDPKNNLAHHHLGQLHKVLGNLPAALEDFRRAHDLDPHHPRTHVDLALVLRLLGRVPEARAIVEDGMTHVVDNAELHEALADVLEAEGRADESMEERLKSRLMAGATFDEIDQLRRAYGEGGRPGELRKENALLMENLQGKGANHGVRGVATALAENSALLRDRDQTLRWLGEAFERREEGPLSLNQPAYDFVRADSRFKAYRERLFGPNRHSAQK